MKEALSLQDYAFKEIKLRIQNGTYPPGKKLNTQEISDSLGISRSPVLAAINRLIPLGLVEALPRKGTIVTKLSVRQIKDIIEARQMIEMFSVKLAIKNSVYHPKIMKDMESLIEQFNDAIHSDYTTAADLDTRFHTHFVELSRNTQIMRFYESNWSVGAMFYLYNITHMPLSHHDRAFKHHTEIFESLKAKDEKRLHILIQEHMSILYETLDWYAQSIVSDS